MEKRHMMERASATVFFFFFFPRSPSKLNFSLSFFVIRSEWVWKMALKWWRHIRLWGWMFCLVASWICLDTNWAQSSAAESLFPQLVGSISIRSHPTTLLFGLLFVTCGGLKKNLCFYLFWLFDGQVFCPISPLKELYQTCFCGRLCSFYFYESLSSVTRLAKMQAQETLKTDVKSVQYWCRRSINHCNSSTVDSINQNFTGFWKLFCPEMQHCMEGKCFCNQRKQTGSDAVAYAAMYTVGIRLMA